MAPRVAVIGAGPIGLMALKTFKQDGFDVTLYESRSWVGGLWKPDADEALSALATTRFNSSKYRSAIPDFPMPADMDDYPTAPQLYKYLNSYADQFDLWPHIRLRTKAMELLRTGETWLLWVAKDGEEPKAEQFDKVAFATGTFTKPRYPHLDGIELFQGPAEHSVTLSDPSKYDKQTVLIIGLHASAQDAVAALAGHATKIYAAHRSGLTLLSRYTADGSVLDRMPPLNFTLFMCYLSAFSLTLYTWLMDFMLNTMSKKTYPDQSAAWGFSPAPSLAVTTPLIADEIWPHLQSGFCEPVKAVKRFIGPRSVELADGRVLNGIDVVVYCTGFDPLIKTKLPADVNPYPVPKESSVYYRHIFPVHSDKAIRNSLSLLGHGAFPLPGFSQFQAQIHSVSQIWLGRSALPSLAEMEAWCKKYRAWRAATAEKYNAQSTFYPFMLPMADYASWLDETAGLGLRAHFGFLQRWTNFCAWKLWWNDRELYKICQNGLSSPALYLLFDMGKRAVWSGARSQVFADNDAVQKQQERRQAAMRKENKML